VEKWWSVTHCPLFFIVVTQRYAGRHYFLQTGLVLSVIDRAIAISAIPYFASGLIALTLCATDTSAPTDGILTLIKRTIHNNCNMSILVKVGHD